jgi:hypothetical protein
VSGDGAVQSFDLEYDQLIVAVGCDNTTFGTPGVEKYCHFLKELNGAWRLTRPSPRRCSPLRSLVFAANRRPPDQAADYAEL